MGWLSNRLPAALRPGLLTRCQPVGLAVAWLERGATLTDPK
jgi:hypothetical protein